MRAMVHLEVDHVRKKPLRIVRRTHAPTQGRSMRSAHGKGGAVFLREVGKERPGRAFA
jgi:hypothetical protein